MDRSHGGFFAVSGFTDFLVSEGWEVVVFEEGPITTQALTGFDILMSAYRLYEFDDAEVSAVESYIKLGGGLWVLHDHNMRPTAVNSLSSRFGVTFNRDVIGDLTDRRGLYIWPNIHVLEEHAIMDGVSSFGYYAGSSLNVTAPAVVIASGDDDSYSTEYTSFPPVMAITTICRGRAVFIGDRTPLHPNYYGEKLDEEEQLLLMNIVNWLSAAGYEPVLAQVDVKPGSCPNPLNVSVFEKSHKHPHSPNRGVLPIAVLGSSEFDVHNVDVSSLCLSGAAPLRYDFEDVGTPTSTMNECDCASEGPDGFVDLTLKFQKSEIVAALGAVSVGDFLPLTLTGKLVDGEPFEGTDCVTIVGNAVPFVKSSEASEVSSTRVVPNPFNPKTRISYSLLATQFVTLSIYDISGRLVETLVRGVQAAGEQVVEWDATLQPSGVYYYRIEGTDFTETGRMVLLK
ncbi:MAG: T9SS type A sorting domain-containing protein [Planctomycetota bacterium]